MMLPLLTLHTRPHWPQLTGSLASPKPSSIIPLQLLSTPSQISAPVGVQLYSQPFESTASALTQPTSHAPMPHIPPMHTGVAWGRMQGVLHAPQFVNEVILLKPSSTTPSQLLSFSSQISVAGAPGSQVCGEPLMQLVTVRRH